ncbi:MAG: extracellular solute-binding protein [Tyzzerella sp.]|nr:extracellular solute-binding protein [Tyzzerella sp.]
MKKMKRFVAILLVLVMVLSLGISAIAAEGSDSDFERPVRAEADTSYRGWLTVPEDSVAATAKLPAEEVTLAVGEELALDFEVPKAGDYAVAFTYHMVENTVLDSTVTVTHGEQSVTTEVYSLWQDASKEYETDRYGNEVTPSQVTIDQDVTDYVRNSASVDGSEVLFTFEAGAQKLTILNNDQDIIIKGVSLVELEELASYETYQAENKGSDYEGDPIIIEGENYAVKSDSFIRCKAESNSGVTPYNPYYKWLASVDGNAWNSAGQRIVWNFEVPEDGWYNLTFHYSQSKKEGQESRRTIEIDGVTPYAEFRAAAFPYTGADYDYKSMDGKIYLTAGTHTLGMYVEMPEMAPLIDQVQAIIEELQDIGLSLQQVAGSDADTTRTWEIETYIPGITENLTSIQKELETIYAELEEQYGEEPASSLNLQLSADMIKQILKEPEKLPTRTEEINVGSSSVTSLLAELINGWKTQALSIDNIYLTADNEKLPAANGGFFENIVNGVKRFIFSLTSRDANYGTGTVDEDALTIWVNRSVPYVETIQMLADSRYEGYTDENGNKIELKFSIMPDEGKLLLANASDTSPDVALSVSIDKPYQLGLRGAATAISDFEDFDEYVEDKFLTEAFETYTHDSKIYAMPETQQFYVLMYRTDILERLGLEVPKTWEDVANMMPTLRRNGMNFYMPLSSQTGTKSLENIIPFLYQSASAKGENPDYSLWAEDGLTTTINTETNIEAFQNLTDLYVLYGLQNNMPSFFNNFRYGVSPVGIGTFANYMQMLYAAPEIADDWAIAPVPGFEGEDGEIHNEMPTTDRSAIIFESSEKKEAAWDFIKWWLSDETQIEFAQILQAKFGSEFVWNSANYNAFSELAIPATDREVILKQWQNAQNLRHTPATYMLERSLSDAWYNVVNDHIPVRRALNEAAVDINQEMVIKLQEFGYMDGGEVLKEYSMRPITEILDDISEK